jgi:hypothetical protein
VKAVRGQSRRTARKAAVVLAALAAFAGAGSALAQAVVVSSTGPSRASYPAGKRLAAGARVTLQAGDRVTIIDKAGSRVLTGGSSFVIDGAVNRDSTVAVQIGRALSKPQPVRRGGTVRGPNEPPATEPLPPSVWLADTGAGGRVCVLRDSDLYLWREGSDKRRFAWLGETEGGGMVRLQFPEAVAGVAWPTGMVPLVDGRTYRLTEESNPDNYKDFEVVILDPEVVPVDAQGLAVTLLDNGCRAQFDWMAKKLEAEAMAEAKAAEAKAAGSG